MDGKPRLAMVSGERLPGFSLSYRLVVEISRPDGTSLIVLERECSLEQSFRPPSGHPSSSFVENMVKLDSALFGSALGCMNG